MKLRVKSQSALQMDECQTLIQEFQEFKSQIDHDCTEEIKQFEREDLQLLHLRVEIAQMKKDQIKMRKVIK